MFYCIEYFQNYLTEVCNCIMFRNSLTSQEVVDFIYARFKEENIEVPTPEQLIKICERVSCCFFLFCFFQCFCSVYKMPLGLIVCICNAALCM